MQTLAVANPGSSTVEVTVAPLAGGRAVARVKVAAGGLVVFGPAVVGGLRPLVVHGHRPGVGRGGRRPDRRTGRRVGVGVPTRA